MEILERSGDTIIALLNIEDLKDHEQINESYLAELTRKIKEDKELKIPIVVDKHSNVVLDGHHRFYALQKLGCKRIPAFVVDYYNPDIKLNCWNHFVKTEEEREAVFDCLKEHNFLTSTVENEDVIKTLLASGQAILGIAARNGGNNFFIVQSKDKNQTFEDALQCIKTGLSKELDYIPDAISMEEAMHEQKASLVMIIPSVEKSEVVKKAVAGQPYPPKTTRHSLSKHNEYPIPLRNLMSEERKD